jgi:hypothetical protein
VETCMNLPKTFLGMKEALLLMSIIKTSSDIYLLMFIFKSEHFLFLKKPQIKRSEFSSGIFATQASRLTMN